jgi:hypothetical protein
MIIKDKAYFVERKTVKSVSGGWPEVRLRRKENTDMRYFSKQ